MPFGLNTAPVVFMDLMNRVSNLYIDNFVIVFIVDILIYSKSKEEHEAHLKMILKLLKKEKLFRNSQNVNFGYRGVVSFGKRNKLSPRYVGLFEIVERVGHVAYRLRLLQELIDIHDTFHVSNLKKCLAGENLHVPLEEIKINDKLCFVKERIEILDCEVKKLKRSWIPAVKVCWNSRLGPEFTWEREDEMKRNPFSSTIIGDKNHIRTLGDYSKPSHKGYRNTIELPVGNNMVPLRSDTIRLVQNGCTFHGLLSNDPNQHLKDFLKLMESLDLEGNFMTSKNIDSISHIEREELRRKGIKSPLKLFSPKYLSPASIIELNKNPSAPKRVHFVNLVVIPRKEEVKVVIDEEEGEIVTDEEFKEILEYEEDDEDCENFNSFPMMEELTHHEWLLNNPRPPWVKERTRARSLNNIKISYMIGYFFKIHAYIDLESPINIMSRRQYNQIMTYGLRSRQKPSNLNKISNFLRRVRSLKIFTGSFAYECDFMILEDTTCIIDRHLREMAFGRPFINETSLVYNKEKGTVMFKQNDKKITFKMPHTMKVFKQTRLMGLSIDSIPSSTYEENFGHGRTHYYQVYSLEMSTGKTNVIGEELGICCG
nr:putative reverse transcriptase domain-containing protein [Tanacetum cinerariifolium]